MRICREFENWRALSGKFLLQKSCYPESFRFLWLCLHIAYMLPIYCLHIADILPLYCLYCIAYALPIWAWPPDIKRNTSTVFLCFEPRHFSLHPSLPIFPCINNFRIAPIWFLLENYFSINSWSNFHLLLQPLCSTVSSHNSQGGYYPLHIHLRSSSAHSNRVETFPAIYIGIHDTV